MSVISQEILHERATIRSRKDVRLMQEGFVLACVVGTVAVRRKALNISVLCEHRIVQCADVHTV